MSGPQNKWKHKGLELTEWEGRKFSLRKSYKKKDATEWTEHKILLFAEEIAELARIFTEAAASLSGEPSTQGKSLLDSLPAQSNAADPIPFDDDDIPF